MFVTVAHSSYAYQLQKYFCLLLPTPSRNRRHYRYRRLRYATVLLRVYNGPILGGTAITTASASSFYWSSPCPVFFGKKLPLQRCSIVIIPVIFRVCISVL